MEENEDYGLPDVEYSPIDREAQGSTGHSKQPNKNKMNEQRKKDSKTPVIIAIVLIVIIVLVAGYFFIIKPGQEATETERIAQAEQARIEAEAEAEQARIEEEARQAEEEARLAAEAENAEPETPETGTVTVLSEKSGKSYVVVGSFFDGDMAHDAGNKLASEGVSTYILEPSGGKGFYRLAVEGFDSYADATVALDNYKGTYGDEIWALKY